MKLTVCAVFAAIVLVGGCGSDRDGVDDSISKSRSTPAATPTSASPTAPTPSAIPIATLDVAPGRIGPAKAGMTQTEALATGLFDADVKVGGDGCDRVEPLQWKSTYQESIDVLTSASGTILSMGTFGGIKTSKGVGVGNTLGQINAAYGSAISPAVEAGYGQAGVYVNIGSDWLGFLLDEEYNRVSPASKVTFMEVTSGVKPGLMRDGC